MRSHTVSLVSRISMLVITEIFLGVIVGIGALLVFLKLALSIDRIQELDIYLSSIVYSLRTPGLDSFMIVASYLGSELIIAFLVIFLLLLFLYKKYREIILFLVTIITGGMINIVLKEIISRDRPSIDPLFQEIFHSFPSLHAMNSFVFYSLLVLFIYQSTRNRIYTLIGFLICGVAVLLVGISRVYLGVHYPSDVLAGYVIGLWWVATVLVVHKTISIIRYRKRRST